MMMKKTMQGVLAAALLAIALPVMAGQAVLVTWGAPTTRTDGSSFDPATELDHYVLVCGDESGKGYNEVWVRIDSDKTSREVEVGERFKRAGTYYCVLDAVDTEGLRSQHSNEVSIVLNDRPSAPADITIEVVVTD